MVIRADGVVPFETLSASVFEGAQVASLLETHVLQSSADTAVLEVGCGSAVLSAILQRKGFDATAVDAVAHDLWPLLAIEPRVLALNADDEATRAALDRWAAERSDRRRVMIAVHCCELAEQLVQLARAAQCAVLVVVPCGAACGAAAIEAVTVTRIESKSTPSTPLLIVTL